MFKPRGCVQGGIVGSESGKGDGPIQGGNASKIGMRLSLPVRILFDSTYAVDALEMGEHRKRDPWSTPVDRLENTCWIQHCGTACHRVGFWCRLSPCVISSIRLSRGEFSPV